MIPRRMCAETPFARARLRLRISLSGSPLHHGLQRGRAAPEPEAVAGATPRFRCPVWHRGRLGCVSPPNPPPGSLRTSSPVREGQRGRAGGVPADRRDVGHGRTGGGIRGAASRARAPLRERREKPRGRRGAERSPRQPQCSTLRRLACLTTLAWLKPAANAVSTAAGRAGRIVARRTTAYASAAASKGSSAPDTPEPRFTRLRKCLDGLKAGATRGGTSTGSPVLGLRAVRALRCRTLKTSQPRISMWSRAADANASDRSRRRDGFRCFAANAGRPHCLGRTTASRAN